MMPQIVVNFLALIIFTLFTVPALAQDDPVCNADEAQRVLSDAVQLLKRPNADVADVLRAAQRMIGNIEAHCSGLSWRGDSPYMSDVIEFPDGFYLFRLYDPDPIASMATIEELRGSCGYTLLLLTENDDADATYLATELRGCIGVVSVQASGPWSLTMERLGP